MTHEYANLIYLGLLLAALLLWFATQNRSSLGRLVQHALAWGLIFAGALAVVALWDDIRQAVLPQQSVITAQDGLGTRIELPRAPDGHYYVTAQVNGAPVRFTVDTGATDIVLSQADATAAGIDTETLAYVGRASTANGQVRTAPVRIDLAIGPIHDANLRAFVNDGEMRGSLLGMAYLQRYARIEITGGALTLTR